MSQGRAKRPGGQKGTTKLCERGLLFGFIGGSAAGIFDGIDELKSAGRTVSGGWDDLGSPHLQADLHGADHGEGRHEATEYGDTQSPTQMPDARALAIGFVGIHNATSAPMMAGASNLEA